VTELDPAELAQHLRRASTVREFTGWPIPGLIAPDTDPWVQLDGVPVDWTRANLPRVTCPCGESGQVVLAGVLDGMNTPTGVQRCDSCDTYPGDLDATLALARHVGGSACYLSAEDPGF